jgi:hypothetical protein
MQTESGKLQKLLASQTPDVPQEPSSVHSNAPGLRHAGWASIVRAIIVRNCTTRTTDSITAATSPPRTTFEEQLVSEVRCHRTLRFLLVWGRREISSSTFRAARNHSHLLELDLRLRVRDPCP